MASAASPSTPSGGVGASMWASQPPSKSGWGRGGESGSGFRGMNRGGRPGRGGGGRGGRAGRGGARPNNSNTSRMDDKGSKPNGTELKEIPKAAAPAEPNIPAPTNDTSSSAASKSAHSQTKDTKGRSRKVSEAKPPRKVPPIIIEPPTVAVSNSPVSATTPNRSRRKRSTNRSTPSVTSKKSPSTESSTSHLRPDKSPVIIKDLPPHLAPPPPETPSFDIKHDIDALVERVRAVAMDRPNTPGSHIDWAGEEDDSLPDLDDWGVKSVTNSTSNTSVDQPDLISPILADALKPLPSIELGSPLTVPSVAPPPEAVPQKTASSVAVHARPDGDDTPRVAAPDPERKEKPSVEKPHSAAPKNRKKSDASAKATVPSGPSVGSVATATPTATAEKDTAAKKSPLKQSNLPLHPSLPAKPVGAMDALSKRLPKKPDPPPVHAPDQTADIEPTQKSALSESLHAPKPNGVIPQEQPSEGSPSPEPQGTAASMHAFIHSAPSYITTHSTPSSSSFHPTHGRAHTLGRPGGIRVPPFSPTNGSFPDERASRRDRVNHARNHSSPPTGPGTAHGHSRSGSRPVITVDALSRLARTLGGSSPPSKREVAAGAKE
ncbi:hypothetical protein L226DRAFT_556807 [Lentinus tigrinus ALCF2SS1-7]|uniref:Uncharacterized protein n=1 Tax=Lentinus tigrinus ALCF2SS1-6 TaxID=1328759 RepID=A0A5C2STB0_9APHY|nr:hypothetical protein L227DRAFT_648200 [Lentinus tigrinus ALCF2SS1-6]RPD81014.1 hypothetical protein L226DRAFT_556807 [Lentinus tigrinus ALCF2SS1-7]